MVVVTAYLNTPIDCEIYIEQPEGFGESGNSKYSVRSIVADILLFLCL